MSEAREAVLGRIAAALGPGRPGPGGGPSAWPAGAGDAGGLVGLFSARTEEHGARVQVVPASGDDAVRAAIAAVCDRHGARRVGVPVGFPAGWLPVSPAAVAIGAVTRAELAALDGLDATLTRCALAIAETGTIVLDGGSGQGPRAASLLPDLLVCVVEASAIVAGVRGAIPRLGRRVRETGRPLTFISGPSATSDIELRRVEGVHGPRRLEVVLVSGP